MLEKRREAPKINDVAAADLGPNVSEACERPWTVTSRPVVTARGRVIVSASEASFFLDRGETESYPCDEGKRHLS